MKKSVLKLVEPIKCRCGQPAVVHYYSGERPEEKGRSFCEECNEKEQEAFVKAMQAAFPSPF